MERFWLVILLLLPALGLAIASASISDFNRRLWDEEFSAPAYPQFAPPVNATRAARQARREYKCMEEDRSRVIWHHMVRGGPSDVRKCLPGTKRFIPSVTEAKLVKGLTIENRCSLPEAQFDRSCREYAPVKLLKAASIGALVLPLVFVFLIKIAASVARNNRKLLVRLFAPGMYFSVLALVGLVLVHASILIAAIYSISPERVFQQQMQWMGVVGIVAIVGCAAMIWHSLSLFHRASTSELGVRVSRKAAPRLWAAIDETAKRLGCRPPDQAVVGLEPNFYVTEADVRCCDGMVMGLTMYCSMPLARILSRSEFLAVLGHELGHFKGEDTQFSQRFYPIYRGIDDSIKTLDCKLSSMPLLGRLTLIPAIVGLKYFLEEFSVVEREVGRARELAADKVGASISGEIAMGSALVKIHAFSGLWSVQKEASTRQLLQGGYFKNPSKRFAEAVEACADDDALKHVGHFPFRHPTDTHPPLSFRLNALKLTLEDVSSRALDVAPLDAAIDLFEHPEKLEIELGKMHHVSLANQRGIALVQK